MKSDVMQSEAAPMNSAGGTSTRCSGAEVLVVIPVLNEAGHIEDCLRSLLGGDERLGLVSFVVADGGSTDGSQDIVRKLSAEFPNVSLIHNPDRVQSAAVNLVARAHAGARTMLVRCDAHAFYPPGYVMQVADALVARDVDSIVVPMDAVGKSCFQRANAFIVDTPLGSGGSAHRGGRTSQFVDHGHHAGFRLASFLAVGGYDPDFTHNEDAEFDTRLTKSGGRIFLDADIRLKYLPRATPLALARQYFNYGKGRARTLMKHRQRPKLRQLIPPATLAACVLGLALAPLWPWALLAPAGYAGLLVLASVGVALKMRSACGLLAGVASAAMHMAWSAGFFRQLLAGQRRVG